MLKTILSVIFVLICLALTVIVLLQEGKSQGLALSAVWQRPTGERIKDVPWKVPWKSSRHLLQ